MKTVIILSSLFVLFVSPTFSQDLTKDQTIDYINKLIGKSIGLTLTLSSTKEKPSITEAYLVRKNTSGTYIFLYKRKYPEDLIAKETRYFNIDLAAINRFDISNKTTDDSPVELLLIYLKTTSVAVKDGWGDSRPTQDYFVIPFPNTTENYNRLVKALKYLSDLEKKEMKIDPFGN